jgi:ankyrin repeat protein
MMYNGNDTMKNQLFRVIFEGDLKAFEELIKAGANPDELDEFSWERPIHVAARHGDIEVVRRLLADDRVFADTADRHNRRPLDIALRYEHREVAKMISDHIKAHPDRYDEYIKMIDAPPPTPAAFTKAV